MNAEVYRVEHQGCGGRFVFDRYTKANNTFTWLGTCTKCQGKFALDVLEYYLEISCNDRKPS